ncbi:hypothetical protein [Halosimplex salinum]|uniref:hypothetical protein n=1 Tax=Halosimplex salinum TaxID=1710538 RepID=UPI000F46F557|nr:hypothetical protein [Halosimplex salinum]
MNPWFEVARAAVLLNIVLLLGLATVWARNYRSHGAKHTLGLLVFACVLLAQNLLTFYLYSFHPTFHEWVYYSAPIAKRGTMAVNVLELVAVAFLVKITWE